MISALAVCESGTVRLAFAASWHGCGLAVNQGRLIVKAVESSTVVAFRALVMLACLIVVPMAAIFGSACPDIVRALLIEPLMGSKVASEVCRPKDGTSPLGEGFAANSSGRPNTNVGVAPPWPTTVEIAGLTTASARSGAAGSLQRATQSGRPEQSPAEGTLARFDVPVDTSTSSPWPRFSGSLSDPAGAAGPSQLAAAPAPDRFSMLEKRLRDYGAIYYLLETWGNEGELYRFHCKMAIANNPNYTRHFEATHREAMQAMTQVLEQIEAWRAGRLP